MQKLMVVHRLDLFGGADPSDISSQKHLVQKPTFVIAASLNNQPYFVIHAEKGIASL